MDNAVLGRQIKISDKTGTIRCDFDHIIIPKGRVAYKISQGEAQGLFHGPKCYANARKHYQQLKEKYVAPTQE